MAFNNALRYGQPEPGAALFGRKKRVKELCPNPWRDAFTLVSNGDLKAAATDSDVNGQCPAVWHGLNGIEQEVQEHLLDLGPVNPGQGEIVGPILADDDLTHARFRTNQEKGFFHDFLESFALKMRRTRAGKFQKLIEEEFDALQLALDNIEIIRQPVR